MSKIVHLLCALLLAAPPVHTAAESAYVLPASIDAPDDLRRQMGMMLVRSATFRQQCHRLDRRGLHVQIRTDALLLDRPYRARSTIRRLEDGGLTASVRITPFGDPTQWLAHELEHVIEQLDGVRIVQLAAESTRVAWHTAANMYETERAIRVGRLVLHEVHAGHRALAQAAGSIDPAGMGDD